MSPSAMRRKLKPKPKRWLVNGIALTIPLVATLLVVLVVLEFVLGILSPVVEGMIRISRRQYQKRLAVHT
ncbi:hypothetical protein CHINAEXTREME_03355 [Halobiforma lacisalsi AJ5]|uniref:Uncharacterized protein n=1 Tax=Natronobacterium lacisalsi AJ5 TaxID=358396 RepID=M0LP61_NATLA|nr:hypothetical protein [Halobiforma lacisalsi]APW96863.1 hypothetical protein CHINAEXTREME_03355 [Halobiforma lacisalsi AJ5]EMA34893.1 hypothetical protein C445_06583 [Halobiforma lacisalsi AJ5]